ncbi:protein kinase [Streptomyces sp. NPDC091292]|uniref:serine/threonine-protein kinase n=1 Tax=Streptomyces sp. NPDC091292 TaxID=3365991 RepID=UPI003829F266
MGTTGENVRVIAGRYRLQERLGRGGMGIVWRAADQLLDRDVAVKELIPDLSLSDDDARQQRERSLREARAVARLRHPHLVVVHDVVEHEERPYIVMELIEGGSLADRLSGSGPVDAGEAARIGLALLGALRAAHAAGVLHRDLKPANVLLEAATGRVVLTDFGIARVAGATTLTENGQFVGSPEYTAPERISGSRTGPEADLWSLGALLCAALSGASPFRRDSLGGILHAVLHDEIHPPAEAEPLLPVVRGLLDRDPDTRLDAAGAEKLLRGYQEYGEYGEGGAVSDRVADGDQAGQPDPRPGDRTAAPPAPASGYTPTRRDVPSTPAPRGAATPPPAQATGGGTEAPKAPAGRGRSPRRLLVTAALVAALAGAGVSGVALLMDRGRVDDRVDDRAAGAASPDTRGPTPTVTVTREHPTAGSPSPVSRKPPTAPAGYRVARDPDGFTVAVPDGFTRSPEGPRIFYLSPDGVFRIGIKAADTEPGGPVAVMRRSAARGPANNPGYREGEVTPTTHDGRTAALWEFTWNGFTKTEGPRHTFDLCWEEDGRMYDIWVSAPLTRVAEARAYFDSAVDSFTPGDPR